VTEIRSIIEACKRLNIDGIFWWIHHACRPMLAQSLMIRDSVTKQLGIPFMVLEGDGYDRQFYSFEALRTNIEAFAEMLRTSHRTRHT